MSGFEMFGQLVVDLWSLPEHQHLTNHHVESVAAAEDQLHETIEEVAAYDPPPDRRPDAQDFAFHLMKTYVTGMGGAFPEHRFFWIVLDSGVFEQENWQDALVDVLAEEFDPLHPPPVLSAVAKLVSNDIVPALGTTYLAWMRERWEFWRLTPTAEIDIDTLVTDLDILSAHRATRLPGLDFASAGALMADTGLGAFCHIGKPIIPMLSLLLLETDPRRLLRAFVAATIRDNREMYHGGRWHGLPNGQITPRIYERLIRLYVTDNREGLGDGNRSAKAQRMHLARQRLVEHGIIQSWYAVW
jgi:hypothetical protein